MQGRNRAKRTKILNRDMEIHLLTVLRGKGEREKEGQGEWEIEIHQQESFPEVMPLH